MTYPIVTIDWNNGGRAYTFARGAPVVGDLIVAVDLDASCGYVMATVEEVGEPFESKEFGGIMKVGIRVKAVGEMHYWPGSDE